MRHCARRTCYTIRYDLQASVSTTDTSIEHGTCSRARWPVVQLVERSALDREDVGSNPTRPAHNKRKKLIMTLYSLNLLDTSANQIDAASGEAHTLEEILQLSTELMGDEENATVQINVSDQMVIVAQLRLTDDGCMVRYLDKFDSYLGSWFKLGDFPVFEFDGSFPPSYSYTFPCGCEAELIIPEDEAYIDDDGELETAESDDDYELNVYLCDSSSGGEEDPITKVAAYRNIESASKHVTDDVGAYCAKVGLFSYYLTRS